VKKRFQTFAFKCNLYRYVMRCLESEPSSRLTAREMLAHPWLANHREADTNGHNTNGHNYLSRSGSNPSLTAADASTAGGGGGAGALLGTQRREQDLLRIPSFQSLSLGGAVRPEPQRAAAPAGGRGGLYKLLNAVDLTHSSAGKPPGFTTLWNLV
jgi:serine/threonine protein kinase